LYRQRPCSPGFRNDQTAAALADADATLVVRAAVPNVVSTLTPAALAALSGLLRAAVAWRLRRGR
jgi:thiamine pyrophosphate-dependent acetolactate synthase large subunit-like protein